MPDNPARQRDRAAAAVELYLAAHPAAADGVHGIAQWWLPELGVDAPEAAVAEVASMDVDAGEGGGDAGAPRGGVGLGAQLPPRRSSARKRRAPHQHPQSDQD